MRGKAKKQRGRGRPFEKGDPRAGRPKGTPNKVTLEAREIARSLVQDPEYLREIRKRLHDFTLQPQLAVMLWHYAYGKPKETHEVSGPDGGPLELLTRIERVIVDVKNAKA